MADANLEFTFKCSECGPTSLSLPDNYTDDSIAKCKSCGMEFGRYGDIKAEATKIAKADVSKRFREGMKRAGWDVK